MLTSTTSEAVWQAFESECIFRYGAPQIVISDNGPEFLKDFHANLGRRNIKHTYITPLNPRSNGQVERYVRILKGAIRRICAENPNSLWISLIYQAIFSVRILVSRATRVSSFELLYGYPPGLPGFGEFQAANFDVEGVTEGQILEHMKFMKEKLNSEQAQERLEEMKKEIQKTMVRREPIAITSLELGDLLYIKNYRSGPLDMKATGPCIFLEYLHRQKLSALVFNMSTKRLHRVKTAHISPINVY